MKTKTLSLVLAVIFAGCVRRPCPPPVPTENDTSIALPHFFGQPAVGVGAEGQQYALDGAVLQALMIATNDYIPPGVEDRPCWGSPRAHRYRVIRKGDIIFVDIEEDLEACGLQYIVLHSGVTYAISTDGRILRRVIAGTPEDLLIPEPPEEARPPASPGTPPGVDAPGSGPSPGEPSVEQGRGAGATPSEPPPVPAPRPEGGP